jgi:hypothetical protein
MRVFFGVMETFVSGLGISHGLTGFYEWENITRMSRNGNIFSVYHKVNPALPTADFRISNSETESQFEETLTRHQITVSNHVDPQFNRVRLLTVLGFGLNLAVALCLRVFLKLDLRLILVISFALGIVLTIWLEKVRGISKQTRRKAAIEKAH